MEVVLSFDQMQEVCGGKVNWGKVLDGVCYAVLGADLGIGIAVWAGAAVNPVVGTVVVLADLGCTIRYIAS